MSNDRPFAPDDDVFAEQSASEALERAAALWVNEHGLPPSSEPYSTAGNLFLAAAERAWWVIEAMFRLPDEPPAVELPTVGFFVYWLYDEHDRLLYIGMSRAVRARIRCHERTYPGLIARVELDRYETAAEMVRAEREQIALHQPPLNVEGIG